MGRECVIITATITLVDITARADKDTFSMTTKDPAQVWATRSSTQEAFELYHAVLRALHTAFSCILISVNIVCALLLCFVTLFLSVRQIATIMLLSLYVYVLSLGPCGQATICSAASGVFDIININIIIFLL